MNASPAPAAFDRLGPAVAESPVLLSVPHAGRHYPADLLAEAQAGAEALAALEDRHADRLVAAAVAAGITALVAPVARAAIDLNRDPRELDRAMVTPAPPRAALLDTAKVRLGLGLVPRRIGDTQIYRTPIALATVQRRVAALHAPWHAALAAELATRRARFGVAVLLDCHSMPPLVAGEATVVLGDLRGVSAGASLVAVAKAAAEAAGHRVACNRPYAGAYTLARHGHPHRGVHALQLELDRRCYLDDALAEPGPGLAAAQALVRAIVAALEEAVAPGALAAE